MPSLVMYDSYDNTMPRKHKVHAQRKFAQGVYVPNNNNNVVDRKTIPVREEPKSVIKNDISAIGLLDLLSFERLHKHITPQNPIVILSRLESSSNAKKDTIKKRRRLDNEDKAKVCSIRSKIKKLDDDDQPLTFFAKNNVSATAQSSAEKESPKKIQLRRQSERITPSLKSSSSPVNIINGDLKDIKPCVKKCGGKLSNQKRMKTDTIKRHKIRNLTKKTKILSKHNRFGNKILKGTNIKTIPNGAYKKQLKSTISVKKPVDSNIKKDIKVSVSKQKVNGDVRKELKTVAESCKKEGPIHSKRTETNEMSKRDSLSNKSRNITENRKDKPNVFKVPKSICKPRTRSDSQSPTMKSSSEPAKEPQNAAKDSPTRKPVEAICPSEKMITINDVINAPKPLLKKCCEKCDNCKRVNSVVKISSLLEKKKLNPVAAVSTVDDNGDVYEFNVEETNDSKSLSEFRRKKDIIKNDENSDAIYLDIMPGSSQIIQIYMMKTPNKDKLPMRARLVPKSGVKINKNVSLAEHGDLLNQLVNTLSLSLHGSDGDEELTRQSLSGKNLLNLDAVRNVRKLTAKSDLLNSAPRKEDCKSETDRSVVSGKAGSVAKPNKEHNVESAKIKEQARLMEAPVYHPTEQEFQDPIVYFEKILPEASKFGICKIVPPSTFKPECCLGDEFRFNVTNQYISRLYSRWGSTALEMATIKAYLASQGVIFTRPPLLEGVEVDLPKLYHLVQRHGGLKKVMEKKKWSRIAEDMKFPKDRKLEKKLDQICVKYLLPYHTLSHEERKNMMSAVEAEWHKKYAKMLNRALNPLHRQQRLLGELDSSDEETDRGEEQKARILGALREAEDCIVTGRQMNLLQFKKVAETVREMHIPNEQTATLEDIEEQYWRILVEGKEHVCVYTASVDTGEEGYGFTKNKNVQNYGKHLWNLKMIIANAENALRLLGPALGVTVPTLHVGMLYSTSCWHRDPHALPWLEYMHQGKPKIWYGIPGEQSENFRRAVAKLCPSYCQNKSVWLPSDILMIPPDILKDHNVSLSKVIQKPGEYIMVFPKAYSSSISTGFTISESVYFATASWLARVEQLFKDLRSSCEPTMFPLEQLLISSAKDNKTPLDSLKLVAEALTNLVTTELNNRRALEALGVKTVPSKHKKRPFIVWNVREQEECDFCCATLYLSNVVGFPHSNSSLCPEHAIALLKCNKYKKHASTTINLQTYYSPSELEKMLEAMQKRLAAQPIG